MTSQVFGNELGNYLSEFDSEKALAAAKETTDQMHNEEIGGLLLGMAVPAAKKLGEKALAYGQENLSKALSAGKQAMQEVAEPDGETAGNVQETLADADPEGDVAGLGETLGEDATETTAGDVIDGLLATAGALDASGIGAVAGTVVAAGVGIYSLVTGLKDIFDHPHEDPGPPPSLPVWEPGSVSNLG